VSTTTHQVGYFHFFGDLVADLKKNVPYFATAMHVVLEEMFIENVDERLFHGFEDFINRLAKQCGIVIEMDGKLGHARYTYRMADAVIVHGEQFEAVPA
jgi:hypothetical protein